MGAEGPGGKGVPQCQFQCVVVAFALGADITSGGSIPLGCLVRGVVATGIGSEGPAGFSSACSVVGVVGVVRLCAATTVGTLAAFAVTVAVGGVPQPCITRPCIAGRRLGLRRRGAAVPAAAFAAVVVAAVVVAAVVVAVGFVVDDRCRVGGVVDSGFRGFGEQGFEVGP